MLTINILYALPRTPLWNRLAAEGRAFYTEATDHHGCPIGAYTHGTELTGEVKKELEGVVATMLSLNYIRAEEIPGIPRREGAFGVAVYAPLALAEGEPDVVIIAGNARQIMLLAEAAGAGAFGSSHWVSTAPA